jgi:hypothetical protein
MGCFFIKIYAKNNFYEKSIPFFKLYIPQDLLVSSIETFEQMQAAYPACCKPYLHMQAVSNKEFGYSSGHIHS